uniref:AlNc14C168G7929 protein n=1 Tax=Albugo laibachii Nc14 TaxID=890382 RepID=F0WN97_9STRA|nr:AlNc14C168G7929 [Albugo laibachii Nc14]|eukprot:CCA22786.1 AlNc14C168G7929 [Albugo laibachii Nc14]
MANDISSAFRTFARKKLQEAKEKTATIVNVTASKASTLKAAVPSTSFGFYSKSREAKDETQDFSQSDLMQELQRANSRMGISLDAFGVDTMSDTMSNLDSINASLIFTVDKLKEYEQTLNVFQRQLLEIASVDDKGSSHEGGESASDT